VPDHVSPEGPVRAAADHADVAHLEANVVQIVEFNHVVVAVVRDGVLRRVVNPVMRHTVRGAANDLHCRNSRSAYAGPLERAERLLLSAGVAIVALRGDKEFGPAHGRH